MDDQNYIYLLPAGGSIDNLGLIVEARCEHGSSYLPLMDGMCSGYDPNAADQIQTVTVQYNGCSAQIQIYSYPPMQFSDVNYSTWYYGYVEYVYALGLMTGLNDTYFGAVDPLAELSLQRSYIGSMENRKSSTARNLQTYWKANGIRIRSFGQVNREW